MEERRKSSLKPTTVLFFVFAFLCVVAFLIVILVKSCDAEREEDKVIDQLEQISQLPAPATSAHLIYLG